MAIDTSILLCSVPRCGSWLLADACEATGQLGHPREYFRSDYEITYRRAWGLSAASDFPGFLGKVIAAGSTVNGVFSTKLHWGQFAHLTRKLRAIPNMERCSDAENVAAVFSNPKYVFLTRANKCEQAISLYRANLLDEWWEFEGDPAKCYERLTRHELDFVEIDRLLDSLVNGEQAWLDYFKTALIVPIFVSYESLSFSYHAAIYEFLKFLAVGTEEKYSVPDARLRKQADQISHLWLRQYLDWKAGKSERIASSS